MSRKPSKWAAKRWQAMTDIIVRNALAEANPAPESGHAHRHVLQTLTYPCGCTATGVPGLPDYCGEHRA